MNLLKIAAVVSPLITAAWATQSPVRGSIMAVISAILVAWAAYDKE